MCRLILYFRADTICEYHQSPPPQKQTYLRSIDKFFTHDNASG